MNDVHKTNIYGFHSSRYFAEGCSPKQNRQYGSIYLYTISQKRKEGSVEKKVRAKRAELNSGMIHLLAEQGSLIPI